MVFRTSRLALALAAAIVSVGAVATAGDPPTTQPAVKATDTATTGTVRTTASGLQIEELKIGTGAEAGPGENVTVHYTGTLTNGRKFDSSLDYGKPLTFKIGTPRIIKGWNEGVAGMKEGGKRKLTIPPALAYGTTGRPPVIPPNATLVFEIELLKVE